VTLHDEITAQQRIADLQITLIRVQRQVKAAQARSADLVQAVYQGARDAATIAGPAAPVKAPKRRKTPGPAEVALLHLTDTHIGAVTASYDSAIAEERIRTTILKTIHLTDIQRKDHDVDHCVVILGGDLIEQTAQFPHQAWAVDASTFEQLFDAARIIEAAILTLLEHFATVEVYLTPGNHGRVGRGKGRQSFDYETDTNWDRIIGRIIGERLDGQDRLTWHPCESWYSIVEVGAYRALAHHGDTIRAFGGNIPAYGILKKHLAWASGVMPEFRDAYLGHFHTPMQLAMNNGGRIFVTPSMVSDSMFAKEFVAAVSPPAQRLHFVDPDRGRVTAEYLILL
jgi:DNA repair exonuclease SbcCD nuclease subunit